MKTKQILFQLILGGILISLSSYSPPNPAMNAVFSSNFTVSLSTTPVQGNTEYDLIVSYANGNHAYEVTPYTGFYFISASAKDVVPGQNTVFRIKTYSQVTHIAGVVTAITCSPDCYDSGSKYFSF